MRLINRCCCVCGSSEKTEAFRQDYKSITALNGDRFTQVIEVCRNCGFTYSNPSPAAEALAIYYQTFSNYENPQNNGKASASIIHKWDRLFRYITAGFSEDFCGRVLGIGCATGVELSIFKSNGWDVIGIDPSPQASKIAREIYGIEVICSQFDNAYFSKNETFDVIIISHVLEHLLSPEKMLKNVKSYMSNIGIAYVEVPNLLKPFVPMGYFTFEHLNYFTPHTLSRLMIESGYSVEIDLFDQSPNGPSYPVIAAIGKKDLSLGNDVENDFEAAFSAIQTYRKKTDKNIIRLQHFAEYIAKNTAFGKIGIWGAGIHTSQLLSLNLFSKEQIACVFENDPKKIGKHINDIKIIKYRSTEQIIEIVDAIVISSKAFQEEIYHQIKHLEEYGIKIYKLYG